MFLRLVREEYCEKRVILYILSVIGIVILNCLYVNFEFMVMLVMVIVIPLFSYIIFSISNME